MAPTAVLPDRQVPGPVSYTETMPHLTPSALALLEVLCDGREYTFKDLTMNSPITPRTIRNAIALLRRQGLIVAKFNFRDGRQILYRINDPMVCSPQPYTYI